jgi:isopentenyl-diphosphate delta-isomerase
MTEQKLILVDENDNFLGYAPKSRCHTGSGLHHRAFTILILNNKNEVLLQKRRHKIWDGFWDLTNSHPLHLGKALDETYEQAVNRCLKNEWGIQFPVKKLFSFNYFAKFGNFCENEYCVVFVGKYKGKVYPNSKVIYDYKWVFFEKLQKDLKKQPEKYTPWLIKALKEFQEREFKIYNKPHRVSSKI